MFTLGDIRGVAWNTFLALIPVGLAYLIVWLAGLKRWRVFVYASVVILALIWLAFLPNTCYLLTEWRHFLATVSRDNLYFQWRYGHDSDAMILLAAYSVFFLAYSLFGMMAFALAIRPIAVLLTKKWPHAGKLGLLFFPLVAMGVYLGLILRFNSWDFVQRPGEIFSSALNALSRPRLASFILVFSGFLWVSFVFFDIWFDGLFLRMRKRLHDNESSQ